MTRARLGKIREQMANRRIDALLLTNIDNVRYVSGFTGSTATAVVTPDRAVILVDPRYTLQASRECADFEVKQYSGDVLKAATDLLNELLSATALVGGFSEPDVPVRLGFEAEHISYSAHRKLRRMISKQIRLVGTRRIVESLRIVKEAAEMQRIGKAAALADECFSYIVERIKPGMTERDAALEIDIYLRKHGADKSAFETIAAAGPNAALPHHRPDDTVLAPEQMVILDFGASVGGYNSDLTRTIFLGEPDEKFREVYGVVLEAQRLAIEAIRPGRPGKEIDSVARDYIASRGYGDYFGHGLGHSLGMATHDGPGLSQTSDTVLAAGMVMTVEPGIYIEGWGGVRIEDDIVVTESGAEVLTTATKEIVGISDFRSQVSD